MDINDHEITFKDKRFEALVRKALKKPNGAFSMSDIESVTVLDIRGEAVSDKEEPCVDLSALKHFVNLKVFCCSWIELDVLDVSANRVIEALSFTWIRRPFTLIAADNPKLEYISCKQSKPSFMDVSGCPILKTIDCQGTGGVEFSGLDVSNNPLLETLDIEWCQKLTSLDISNNPALKYLACGKNALTELDVSHNPLLEHLRCGSGLLIKLDVYNTR